jgi:hypothetical protein
MSKEKILALLIVGLFVVLGPSAPTFSIIKETDAQPLPQPQQPDNSTAQLAGANGSLSFLNNLDIDEARGTFGSVQTDDNNKTWIATGDWDMVSDPAQNKPISFNATINLVTTNNSEGHEHNINSFQLKDGSLESTAEGSTLVLNGTVSLETDDGAYTDVPISVKIIDESPITVSIGPQSNNIIYKWLPGGGLFSVWIDPEAVEDHFGNTPVYGGIRRP